MQAIKPIQPCRGSSKAWPSAKITAVEKSELGQVLRQLRAAATELANLSDRLPPDSPEKAQASRVLGQIRAAIELLVPH